MWSGAPIHPMIDSNLGNLKAKGYRTRAEAIHLAAAALSTTLFRACAIRHGRRKMWRSLWRGSGVISAQPERGALACGKSNIDSKNMNAQRRRETAHS